MTEPAAPRLSVQISGDRAKALLDLFAEIGATPASGMDCLLDHLVRQAKQGTLLIAENMIGYDRLTEDGAPDPHLAVNDDVKVWVDQKPTWNEGVNGFHVMTLVTDGYGNAIAEDHKGTELARTVWDMEMPDATDSLVAVVRKAVTNAAHEQGYEIDAMLRETNPDMR